MPVQHHHTTTASGAAPPGAPLLLPPLRHRPSEAGVSVRLRAQRLRAAELAEQHQQGLPLLCLCGALILDIAVVHLLSAPSGLLRAVVLASLFTLPLAVAHRWYPAGDDVRRLRATAWRQRLTALLLHPTTRRGWVWVHDRELPGTRLTADSIGVAPDGSCVYLRSERLRAGASVSVRDGVLHCGRSAYPWMLSAVRGEAQQASETLGRTVTPLLAVHGAAVPGGCLRLPDGLVIVAASRLRHGLIGWERYGDAVAVRLLALRVERFFPSAV